ncbi:MAG: hypothetical protein LWX83_01175 [Anaerolineae bacterium]|nr:hypothetical protein [Anaerolineae bacterium]
MNKRIIYPLFSLLISLSLAACSALTSQNSAVTDKSIEETTAAIQAWQTQEAMPSPSPLPPTELPTDTPQATVEPSPTASPLPPTTTSEPTLTPSLTPTNTTTPTNTPVPGLAERIRSANILIYEDMGENNLVPRIDRGLDLLNLSGGRVVNTHNNLPLFTKELENTNWDLIIIDAEGRDTILLSSLGAYDEVVKHVENGGALIVEYWNMDEDSSDLASFIEDKCQIRVEKNWVREEGYNYSNYMLYDLNQGSASTLFYTPFKINPPIRPNIFWTGDIGDLMVKLPGSSAQFATGLVSKDPSRYGLLTTCNQGRIILQTFSTHDYRLFETTELWANYIHFTLSNHFAPPLPQ